MAQVSAAGGVGEIALSELDLSWCSRCEDAELGSLFRRTPLLTVLKLRCLNVQDEVLLGLGASPCFSRLRVLDLERCNGITDGGFVSLAVSDNAAVTGSLEKINVSWTFISSRLLAKLLLKNAKTLRKLRLQGCRYVDHSILAIFQKPIDDEEGAALEEMDARMRAQTRNPMWPNLELVDCAWVDGICDDRLLETSKRVPNVTFIGYYGTKFTFRVR